MKKTTLLLFGILLAYTIFVILSMNQPFHGDEIVFSESAKAILEKGAPIFDYGALKLDFQGLWHTPLYIYIMSLFILIFGKSIYVFRSVSAIFNLGVIVLIYLIGKEIFKRDKNREKLALIAVLLYALNPLTIQSSIILDIDGGLLNFAVYLFLFFYIKGKKWYYLMPGLLLVFLSKETGPVVLFSSIILLKIFTKDWKKIGKTILMFVITGFLFLLIFGTYTSLLNLDFFMPFKHNIPFLKEKSDVSFLSSLMTMAWSFKTFFYFAVPFFVLLFFILSVVFYYKTIKGKFKIKEDEKKILLLNIFSLITILMFFYLGASAWGFPKYYITALPTMSIFIIYMLKDINFALDRKKILFFLLLSIILLFYFLIFIPSPLMPEFDSTAKNADIVNALFLVVKTFVLYTILPLLICLLVFKLAKFKKIWIISLIFLTIFSYLYINSLHAVVDYSTYSTYGDNGVMEVIDYFKKNNIETSKISAYPHIGSYIGMSEFYEITAIYNSEKDFKEKIIDNNEIIYIVIYKRDIDRIGGNIDYFSFEKKIGSYYIYKKK